MEQEYKEWTELEHPIWGKDGIEEGVHNIVSEDTFPKKIWRKGKYSIVPPCGVTMNEWELYDGKEIERFATLEEAKEFADNSNSHANHNKIEELAEKIHLWYLEATKELHPESFNPNAQKTYSDLTEEQKFIDRYMAGKIEQEVEVALQKFVEDQKNGSIPYYNEMIRQAKEETKNELIIEILTKCRLTPKELGELLPDTIKDLSTTM